LLDFLTYLALTGVVVFVVARQLQHKQEAEDWLRTARMLGFRVRRGGFGGLMMTGSVGPDSVQIRRETRGAGKHRHYVTVYRFSYRGGPRFGFEIRPQGVWDNLKQLFGARDVQIGDRSFDNEVLIRGARARRLIEYLTPERKARVRQMLRSGTKCEIRNSSILLVRNGVDDGHEIRRTLARLRGLSDALRVEHGDETEPSALGRAVVAQREGRLEEVKPILDEARQAGTPEIEVAAVESELLGTALPDLPELEPLAPEPVGEDGSHEPAVADSTAAEQHAPSDSAPAEQESLDKQTVCDTLFSPRLMSRDAQALFETSYEGREVDWAGELKRVEPFSFDLVFGDQAGTRATFEIGEVGGELVFARTVQAIVQLPAESQAVLRARIGERLRFTGRLTRCDAFVRNLYVSDARLPELTS